MAKINGILKDLKDAGIAITHYVSLIHWSGPDKSQMDPGR